jgi:hypothetical protein
VLIKATSRACKAYTFEKGKRWQNLIETQFKVQLRMADFKFERATTLDDMSGKYSGTGK